MRRNQLGRQALRLAAIAVLAVSGAALAADLTYTTMVPAMTWGAAGNWTPAQLPVAGDKAIFQMPTGASAPTADFFINMATTQSVGNIDFTLDTNPSDTTTARTRSLIMFSQTAGSVFSFDTNTGGATESLVTVRKSTFHTTFQQGLQMNSSSGSVLGFDLKNNVRFANAVGYHGSAALEHAAITGTNRTITVESVDPTMTMGLRLRYTAGESANVTFTGNWVIKGSGYSTTGGIPSTPPAWSTTFTNATASTNSRIYLRDNDPFGPLSNGVILQGGTLDVNGGTQATISNTWARPLSGTGVVEARGGGSNAGILALASSINIGVSSVIPGAPDEINFYNAGLGVDVSAATLNVDAAVGQLSPGTYTILQQLNNFAFTGSTFAAMNLPSNVTLATTPNTTGNVAAFQLVITAPSLPGWINTTSGSWNVSANWNGGVPNAIGAEANFNATNSAPLFVYSDTAVTVGKLKFDSANQFSIGGAGSLTVQVSTGAAAVSVLQGSHQLNLPTIFASDTNISIANGATLTLSNPVTVKAGRTVSKAGSLIVTAPLALEANATLSLATGAMTKLFLAPTLGAGARIDVQGGTVLVDYTGNSSPASALRAQLASGCNGGGWNGPGIVSSLAASDVRRSTGLGYADNGSAVSIRYTWYGDANLDGLVNAVDLGMLVPGGSGWGQGDFNYDGRVSADDYALLSVSVAHGAGTTLPVPEPVGVVLLAAWPLMAVWGRVRQVGDSGPAARSHGPGSKPPSLPRQG